MSVPTVRRFITGLVLLALTAGNSAVRAQVAPDAISTEQLQKSINAVLGETTALVWKAVPLRPKTKQAVEPALKNTKSLPDTMYVGQVATEDGPRYLIPDTAPSKSEIFSYVLYLDASGAVVDVDVLKYRENYGYEIDYSLFRDQFHGMDQPDEVVFRRTVQNISGATISARSLTYAVHDLLTLVNELGAHTLQ